MEWAQAFEAATTSGFEVDVIADNFIDSRSFANDIDVGFADSAHCLILGQMRDG
jgi:hypothetical protein